MGSPTRQKITTTPVTTPVMPQTPPKNGLRLSVKGGAARRNVDSAKALSVTEAAECIGVRRETMYEWKNKGCPGIDKTVNLGKVLAWREEQAKIDGAQMQKMESLVTGTLTRDQILTEIDYHKLLAETEQTSRRRGEWVPVKSVIMNQSVMLGRMMTILRMLPDTVDEELELAMSCECGGCELKRAERKRIIRDAVDEVAEVLQAERVVNGFDDELPEDLENMAAEMAEEEPEGDDLADFLGSGD